MLLLACAILLTGPPRSLAAVRQSLWESAKEKLTAAQEKLDELGIEITVAKEGTLQKFAPDAGFNVNCELSSAESMKVEMSLHGGGGESKLAEVGLGGSFEWSDGEVSVSGEGSVEAEGSGLSSTFTYNHSDGFKWEIGADESIWTTAIQIGDKDAGPFAGGIKLGPVTVMLDPYKLAKYVADHGTDFFANAKEKIGGVSARVNLTDLAYALRNAPEPPPHFAEGRIAVSLKKLAEAATAGKTSDLGDLNHIDGLVIDRAQSDVLLLGTHDAALPAIPVAVLTALARAEFVDGMQPWISIDPDWTDLLKPSHPRVGGVPDDLRSSELIRRMLLADDDMKRFINGKDPLPGLQSMGELLTPHPEDIPLLKHRFWIMPRPLLPGEVRKGVDGARTLYTFATEPVVRTEPLLGFLPPSSETGARPTMPEPDIAASELTALYPEVERMYPAAGFAEVRQILEISTAMAVMRLEGPGAATAVDAVAALDVPKVEIPTEFTNIVQTINGPNGKKSQLVGGVTATPQLSQPESSPISNQATAGVVSPTTGWSAPSPPIVDDVDPFRKLSPEELASELDLLAGRALQAGDGAKAASLARQSTLILPSDAGGYLLLAQADIALGKPDALLEDADKAISLAPNSPQAHLLKAQALVGQWFASKHTGAKVQAQKYWDETNAELDLVAKLAPGTGMVDYLRADMETFAGDLPAAIKLSTHAIQLEPDFPPALSQRAQIYFQQGDMPHALDDLNAFLAVSPGDEQGRILRGDVYMAMKQPEEARADYSVAVDADPKSDVPLIKRAKTWFMGDEDGAFAFDDADKAVALNPVSSEAYYVRAEAYEAMQIWASARLNYRLAAENGVPGLIDLVGIEKRIETCLSHEPFTDEWVTGGEAWIEPGAKGVSISDETVSLTVHADYTATATTYKIVNAGAATKATIAFPERRLMMLAWVDTDPTEMLAGYRLTIDGKAAAAQLGRSKTVAGLQWHELAIDVPAHGSATLTEAYRTHAALVDLGTDVRYGTARSVTAQEVAFDLEPGSWDKPNGSAVVSVTFAPDSGVKSDQQYGPLPPESLLDLSAVRNAMFDSKIDGFVSPVTPTVHGTTLSFSKADLKGAAAKGPSLIFVIFNLKSKILKIPGVDGK